MVKIITDSTADFTAAEAAELGIDIVHLRTRFGDEEYVDGIGLSPMQFYEKLVESDVMPCTSQPSPAEFESAFSAALETADEVVAITISAELSGTYQSAVIAAGGFDGRVRVVDSRSASIGEQILVRYAARLASEGRPAAEIESLLAANRSRICVLALLDTLEYLKRGGRISAAVAFAGGVLSIKPVVTLRDGAVALVGKARGSKNGGNLLNQLVEKHGIDFSMPYLLGYTGLSDALLMKYVSDSAALWRSHADELPVTSIGSVIGTHAGPGGIAVAFFGLK
ncbi:MAG TPA: DegV family protein [Candidatus Scatomorpha intestinavium]|mgnify:FL=1|uniref:DegV family protein n=1 Tax=Candidatus Scatomorpha intestinavium TaxID=2840922 RepID=A0A9D0ZGP0_9FIRM|nr:DegV family protein [Candidatus Scatomorpha intestinavium]